jgi:2-iminobutanoate/2-iminopropanoate deaminase
VSADDARVDGPVREAIGVEGLEHHGPIPVGVRGRGLVVLSAVRGYRPADRSYPDDPAEEARQLLANIATALEAGRSSLGSVLRIGVFVRDIGLDRKPLNDAWVDAFGEDGPARYVVEAGGFGRSGKGRYLAEVIAAED